MILGENLEAKHLLTEQMQVANAPHIITFPRSATIGVVEKLLMSALIENPNVRRLELSFAESEFIEVASLIFVIATITSRRRRGLETIIELPQTKRTRDFLRLWGFPEALSKTTGLNFRDVASKQEDRRYFGENETIGTHSFAGVYRVDDDGVRRLTRGRFFYLQTYSMTQRNGANVVIQESDRWNAALVKAVLSKHLSGPNSYVSSRIAYESMTNAIRHSSAKFVVAGSHFVEPHDNFQKSGGFFTLVYWDDGESMIDTLRLAIDQGKPIRAGNPHSPIAPDKFHFIEERNARVTKKVIIDSSFLPDKNTPDELLLLATTFPGITRDITSKGYASEELKSEHPEYDAPGMGLHVLLNTVIDVFGGSVAFRTKNHFMSIKRNEESDVHAKYVSRVRSFDSASGKFVGNMLTIRLPMNPRSKA